MSPLLDLTEKESKSTFPFFELPAEIRLRVYEILLVSPGRTLDLDPVNYRLIRPRLTCFLVCRQMHEEAYPLFYGSHTQPMRIFPTHGRFFHTKKPLLARLGPKYRAAVNTMELTMGPGWSAPPRCQHTGPGIGLADCTSVRTLKILVQVDPSDDIFNGFRGKGNTPSSYQTFCAKILQGIIDQVPSLETVQLDAWTGVAKDAPLVLALARQIQEAKKTITWGPLRGWHEKEDTGGLVGLEKAMEAMGI